MSVQLVAEVGSTCNGKLAEAERRLLIKETQWK